MSIGTAIMKRSAKIAFYGVPGSSSSVTYHRMKGFTDISASKNPREYSRQYVDEESERSDVVGYAPSLAYSFDRYSGNAVHEDIVAITDGEKIGTDAVRSIIIVDTTTLATSSYTAIKRDYSIIPDSEGNSNDAYTYSGTMKANGAAEEVTVTTSDDLETITISTTSGGL